jgi:uncharacterized protein (DUF885 family)
VSASSDDTVGGTASGGTASEASDGPAPAPAFEQAIGDLMGREFEESPVWASLLGQDGYDHRLDDCSAAGFERRAADDRAWLQRFDAFDPTHLSFDQSIDRDLVVSHLGQRVALAEWEGWRRSPEAYLETGITELFLLALRTEDEFTEAAVARLRSVGSVLEEAERNLDASRASALVVERGLAQCVANIGFARDEVVGLARLPANQQRLREAGEAGALAYERFSVFLRGLLPRCSGTYVFGEDRYRSVLNGGELLDLDVASLRRLGWDEYHRVADLMSGLASAVSGGADDWPTAVRRLQRAHAATIDGMRSEYESMCERARRFMTEQDLVSNPADERCEVIPAPAAVRATLAVASYMSPPMFKPSRVGHFFVPYPVDPGDAEEVRGLLESNATYSVATTAVHEAYPGHHWHLMTMKAARPIRRLFTSTYFIEGWALYVEAVMREAGFFSPEEELGQLEARLFRAARIVVDTSLHTGEMTVEEAVTFMHERALLPLPTARSEVARYCSWPTQASAYLTGAVAIERARDDWVAGGGTLRGFHDALAGSGAMPVPLAVRAARRSARAGVPR